MVGMVPRRRLIIALLLVLAAVVAALATSQNHPREEGPHMATIWKKAANTVSSAFPSGSSDPSTAQSALSGAGAAIAGVGSSVYDPGMYDPGPGGYTISGSGAARPYNVNEDPSYLAFIAALDQAQAQAGAIRQQALADADTNLATYKPRIAEAGVEQRRGISGRHEMRGMFRSGQRLRDIGLQQRSEGQQVADLERGVARAKTAANQQYDATLADLARQRAEKALALTSANAGI